MAQIPRNAELWSLSCRNLSRSLSDEYFTMNRRRFITCTLGTAGIAGLGTLGWKASSMSSPSARLKRVTRSSRALGSELHITVHAKSRSKGEKAIEAAFAAIDRVEDVMSLYRCHSQIDQLNRSGALENPAPELVEILTLATQLSKDTEGAFDVTVQPLWELYSNKALPSPAELADARKHVGWDKVMIEPHGILLQAGAQITLNGIAQGYASDVARKALIEHGIEHAILDTGEISSVGRKVESDPWKVAIIDPHESGNVGIAHLEGRAIATSGDYRTVFNEETDCHHLFNPATGRSANDCSSVSVVAPTATQADALSTACFVLGMERGMKFIEDMDGVDALFVAKDGTVTYTANFPLS